MPKLKTHRGAAKRFKVRKSGKVKFNHAKRRHINEKYSAKSMRKLRGAAHLTDADAKNVKRMLTGN